MELNEKTVLPVNFILDITNIPGSSDDVCLKAIEHYTKFLNNPDSVVVSISKAMIGNLTEYYNLSHKGSTNFQLALPHLSEMANFMDSKNTPQVDIESTARIKSFYSLYEKLLIECSEHLENGIEIPSSGLVYDIIATRDVLYPRYQFKLEPENFYKHVYGLILEYMEYINELSKKDPRYGLQEVSQKKRLDISKPKILNFEPNSSFAIPSKDFIDYALETKGIPHIYRYLASLSPSMSKEDIARGIEQLRSIENPDEISELPIVKALKSQAQKESVISLRHSLESELLDFMANRKNMLKDYRNLSEEDFLYIYHKSLYPEHRDYIKIINYLDNCIENGCCDLSLDFDKLVTGGETSEYIIFSILEHELDVQQAELQERITAIRSGDLGDFGKNFDKAALINYFNACSKDYMRYPKPSGYQSFHIIIKTPFGNYEKQFRTSDQNELAEHGNASHSNTYKPYEKENFHRLKVCTPLMPARDSNNDIITPIQLEPIDFGSAIKLYYHQDFSFFSNGISLQDFQATHPNDFDEAFLALSNSNSTEGMLDRISNAFEFLKSFNFIRRINSIKIMVKPTNKNSSEKDKNATGNVPNRPNTDLKNSKHLEKPSFPEERQ